jgi:heme exporter protein B
VRQFLTLLKKDLRIEFRSFDMLSSMGIYAVLVLLVFGVAFGFSSALYDITPMAAGLLWVLAIFTSLLGLNRSFNREREYSAMEALLLAPLDRGALYLAKMLANGIFLSLVLIIAVPLFAFFFLWGTVNAQATPLADTAWLIIVPLVLGVVGVAGVGTLLATLTLHTRGRDVMLALLFIPVIFPLLYSCVNASSMALLGIVDTAVFWQIAGIGLGYDAIMIIVGWALYDLILSS